MPNHKRLGRIVAGIWPAGLRLVLTAFLAVGVQASVVTFSYGDGSFAQTGNVVHSQNVSKAPGISAEAATAETGFLHADRPTDVQMHSFFPRITLFGVFSDGVSHVDYQILVSLDQDTHFAAGFDLAPRGRRRA